MREPPLILVVDDDADNRQIVEARLASQGYATASAADGEAGLVAARKLLPDLILLDVVMPGLDGLEVCQRLKADAHLPFMPVILVTAKVTVQDIVAGLEAGADEYLTKPIQHSALIARVRSILRIKSLHDRVGQQAAELTIWNERLAQRVAEQVEQLERLTRLRRFVSPQIADVILTGGGEALLESHRRDVVVLFCDLRGFTAFAEQAPPDEVMQVLREYHEATGALIYAHEGTLERFLGDGLMVMFNDPVDCPEPEMRAIALALGIRDQLGSLASKWRKRGFSLGCGIGIAQGEATLGQIGFAYRVDYAAIGSVTNLAARLCATASDGQVLISDGIEKVVRTTCRTTQVGPLALKGFAAPVPVYAVEAFRFGSA
jgi:adenylate cyclase